MPYQAIRDSFIHSFIYLPRVYNSNNNSEETVGQNSKVTRDALITAHSNYKPNENTIRSQH